MLAERPGNALGPPARGPPRPSPSPPAAAPPPTNARGPAREQWLCLTNTAIGPRACRQQRRGPKNTRPERESANDPWTVFLSTLRHPWALRHLTKLTTSLRAIEVQLARLPQFATPALACASCRSLCSYRSLSSSAATLSNSLASAKCSFSAITCAHHHTCQNVASHRSSACTCWRAEVTVMLSNVQQPLSLHTLQILTRHSQQQLMHPTPRPHHPLTLICSCSLSASAPLFSLAILWNSSKKRSRSDRRCSAARARSSAKRQRCSASPQRCSASLWPERDITESQLPMNFDGHALAMFQQHPAPLLISPPTLGAPASVNNPLLAPIPALLPPAPPLPLPHPPARPAAHRSFASSASTAARRSASFSATARALSASAFRTRPSASARIASAAARCAAPASPIARACSSAAAVAAALASRSALSNLSISAPCGRLGEGRQGCAGRSQTSWHLRQSELTFGCERCHEYLLQPSPCKCHSASAC